MASEQSIELIRLEEITKRFGGVTALDNVSFEIRKGEVHAIVGENGAGKSTLMKLLAGVQTQDSGKIFIEGKEVQLSSPRESEELGISMVFQELNLFPTLSIAANIFIGKELASANMFLSDKQMVTKTEEVLETLQVNLDPHDLVKNLSVGQKQIVEIARAISRGTQVVIMDEPNSALNEQETSVLFSIINKLKSTGITILYVSHRLEEVFEISNRISVLRDGQYIGTWDKSETNIEEIVTHVVGRKLGEIFPERSDATSQDEVTLSVKGLRLGNDHTSPVNFEVHRGEVLGFAGLEGSGVQDLLLYLFGLSDKKQADCEINYLGKPLDELNPINLINNGWAFIPANRREEGLMLDWQIQKNVSLVSITHLINKLRLLDFSRERSLSEEYIQQLNIATDSLDKRVTNLSGGNQQKVVLAKWLATNPNLIILNDPTRGIDVGTKRDIYNLINDWSQKGYTILLTSSEIEEIIGLSDRILVFYKNQIIREFITANTNKEEVMRYVLGGEGEGEQKGLPEGIQV